MNKIYDLQSIAEKFNLEGKFKRTENHICGHINDTFILICEGENYKEVKYVLQRINSNIFKKPWEVMENIHKVTSHLRNKIIEENGDPSRETLNIVKTKDGGNLYKDENGNYFRVFNFIEGASTYQIVEKPEHLYTAGKALGKFQKQLCDFDASNLYETIPDFHNTKKRFDAFLEAVKNDEFKRAEEVKEEIEFVLNREKDTRVLVELIEENKLPLRVTHNDTKFNNIMIDNKTGEGIALIDLDTVMPGLSLYDFGDSIRSGATTALEDEVDLEKVKFDLELYKNFTKGFLENARDFLTEEEVSYLPFSAKLMTFECGMRFLTDYLMGDVYFKIHRDKHNLDRARNQFKLVSDMEKEIDSMKNIVYSFI